MTWELFKTRHKKHEKYLRKRQKIKEKENGGSFDLGAKSLGSDTDTKT